MNRVAGSVGSVARDPPREIDDLRPLVATARRLTAVALPGSSVARIGSDEYAVVIEGLGVDEAQAAAV